MMQLFKYVCSRERSKAKVVGTSFVPTSNVVPTTNVTLWCYLMI
jgi:hypothetical protein